MPDFRSTTGNVRAWSLLGAAAVLLLVLAACGDPQPPPGQEKGRVSGTVVVGATGAGLQTPLARATESAGEISGPARGAVSAAGGTLPTSVAVAPLDFVPGEIIVRFADDGLAAAVAATPDHSLEAVGETFRLERTLAAGQMRLYVAPGLDKAATLAAAHALNARPDVAYAELNYLLQPAVVPNDQFYDRQWHYDAINMEAAWDIGTGDSGVVIAVLDSGIIDTHPDFAGRLVPGYDFITSPDSYGDGDARDPDPFDAVDTGGGYHGTHVAGTIGAASNNSTGVAGVDWNAKILPVRVLGIKGGALADIADALIWTIGGSVTDVPTNPNPADVINLSLGGGGLACSQAWQDLFDTVSAFAVVVAAAGNENISASDFFPANCQGLITVGATEFAGERAWYSNFGSAVDIMAPGGDMGNDLFENGRPDGVLSLGYDGSPDYVYMQGTSMAAPHVSGIVGLMKAIDPSVDFERALEALRASATPLSDSACDSPGAPRELFSEDCGTGLIDARLALEYIASGELPPPDGVLKFDPTTLNLGQSAEQADYTITNVSDDPVDWSMTTYVDAVDNPAAVVEPMVLTSHTSGTLAAGQSQELTVFLERELLSADGFYRIWLVFEVDGQPDQLYQVRFLRSDATVPTLSGPMVVAAFREDPSGALITSGEQQSSGVISNFDFEVDAGLNLLGAWSDEDGDGAVNAGDFVGFADGFVNVPAGGQIGGISLRVDPVIPDSGGAQAERYRLMESLRDSLRQSP